MYYFYTLLDDWKAFAVFMVLRLLWYFFFNNKKTEMFRSVVFILK